MAMPVMVELASRRVTVTLAVASAVTWGGPGARDGPGPEGGVGRGPAHTVTGQQPRPRCRGHEPRAGSAGDWRRAGGVGSAQMLTTTRNAAGQQPRCRRHGPRPRAGSAGDRRRAAAVHSIYRPLIMICLDSRHRHMFTCPGMPDMSILLQWFCTKLSLFTILHLL